MKKVILSVVALWLLSTTWVFAADWYKEVSCSSNPIFAQNSCTQCFEWGEVSQWKDLGLLSDIWSNGTSKAMYMLKDENPLTEAVKMISLNGAAWSYEPSEDGFWEYTDSLESLPHEEGFYKLDAGKSVDWIQSKLGYSIRLNKSVEAWKEIGLLKYTINIHTEWEPDTPEEKTISHSECVLFTSAGNNNVVPPKQEPKKLPQTWPQEVLLLLLSLLLAGWLFYFSRKKV